MSKREAVELRTEELLGPITETNGVGIYDVEFLKEAGDYYLRCYIDKEGGVTIDDCESVSRALSDALDREDFIDEAYILEVSSPGLGRALKKDRHLAASLGQEVELKTFKMVEGSKEWVGILKAYDGATVTVAIPVSDEEYKDMVFDRKDIAKLNLTMDI